MKTTKAQSAAVTAVDVRLGSVEIRNLLTALVVTLQRGVSDLDSASAIALLGHKLEAALRAFPPEPAPPVPSTKAP